jgi:hypothetical protein
MYGYDFTQELGSRQRPELRAWTAAPLHRDANAATGG